MRLDVRCACCSYLLQLLLSGEAQAVHGVGPAVCPLAELVGGFGEGHVGGDGAVDDGLDNNNTNNKKWEVLSIRMITWISEVAAV